MLYDLNKPETLLKRDPSIERRAYPRLVRHFSARFRPQEDTVGAWEVPIIENISQGGCYFYSTKPYRIGQLLDIEIQFPALGKPVHFTGKIKRLATNEQMRVRRFGMGVSFISMDAQHKAGFVETLAFFLTKQKTA
ncbi:MAG: PilZ domain-containing protein [Candidatus Omnitrophica bacterium]|nr:PilZ domain-containing protein [Candidatus Omnitrophota bacterium]